MRAKFRLDDLVGFSVSVIYLKTLEFFDLRLLTKVIESNANLIANELFTIG